MTPGTVTHKPIGANIHYDGNFSRSVKRVNGPNFGPSRSLFLFLNVGGGFHDATTSSLPPASIICSHPPISHTRGASLVKKALFWILF